MRAFARPKIIVGTACLGLLTLLGGTAASAGVLAGGWIPCGGVASGTHVAALAIGPYWHGVVPRQWQE